MRDRFETITPEQRLRSDFARCGVYEILFATALIVLDLRGAVGVSNSAYRRVQAKGVLKARRASRSA